jgi:SAM-dependent methyltransferase
MMGVQDSTGQLSKSSSEHKFWALAAVTVTTTALLLAASMKQKDSLDKMKKGGTGWTSQIYDMVILKMTSIWYRAVLSQLPDNSVLLDVGIGTASALLSCKDLIISKNLRVLGMDIDEAYLDAANQKIKECGLERNIQVKCLSIYDAHAIQSWLTESKIPCLNAVYFSGSFSLLPDPLEALQCATTLLYNHKGLHRGLVYITQTYQRRTPPFFAWAKPLLKHVTTIDFGRLITTKEVLDIYESSGLDVKEHNVIPNSVDTIFQGAYLSILA